MKKFGIAQVVLTKGSDGSTLYNKNGMCHSNPKAVKTMADSVGAGDAFVAMFCACTLKKMGIGSIDVCCFALCIAHLRNQRRDSRISRVLCSLQKYDQQKGSP